jgi:hypothetical protein
MREGGSGELSPHDVDAYVLPSDSEGMWHVRATSRGEHAIRLDVWPADGALVDAVEPREALIVSGGDGPVTFAVRNLNADVVAYELAVTRTSLPELGDLLREPNDSEHPQRMTRAPSRWAGFFEGGGDVDALSLSAEFLNREAPLAIEVSSVPDMQPLLRVRGRDGVVLTEVVARERGGAVGIPNLGASLTSLIVEIGEVSNRTSAMPYTVSLHRVASAAGAWELEPNDSAAQPTTFEGTAQAIQGFLHTPSDIDHLALVVPAAAPSA